MKHLKLLKHLETKHQSLKDKPKKFSAEKTGSLEKSTQLDYSSCDVNMNALQASY